MINGACIEATSVSKIKFAEGKSWLVILNDAKAEHRRVRVDGCAIQEGARADWAVERDDAAIVIELKGRDLEHGAVQVTATAEVWINSEARCTRIAGIVVGKQYPRANASLQLKQQKFSRTFRGPLHVITHNAELRFDNIMSFKGPYKS